VLLPQTASIYVTKLDTPETDCFAAEGDSSLNRQIFDEWSGIPALAQIKAIVEPERIGNDIWRESTALINIHWQILSISAG